MAQRCLEGDKGHTWHCQLLAPQGGTDQPVIPKEQRPAPEVLSTGWGVPGTSELLPPPSPALRAPEQHLENLEN